MALVPQLVACMKIVSANTILFAGKTQVGGFTAMVKSSTAIFTGRPIDMTVEESLCSTLAQKGSSWKP